MFDQAAASIGPLILEEVIDPIAALAFGVAIVSFIISLLTYLRDRPKAKVVVMRDVVVAHMRKAKPASITVTNTGRRPITIMSASYRLLGDYRHVAMIEISLRPLNEGDPTTFLFDKNEKLPNGKWKRVAYVFVTDTTGKKYRADIAVFPLPQVQRIIEGITRPFYSIARYRNNRKED